MDTYKSPSDMKASQSRRKSPGWAAFDAQQHQRLNIQPKVGKGPYPPVSSALPALQPCGNLSRNKAVSGRSFSSVVLPSTEFPALLANVPCNNHAQVSECRGENTLEGESYETAVNKLKELYGWADGSLIEDVLSTVEFDINKASTLLKGMTSNVNSDENNETGDTCKMIDPGNLPMNTSDLAAEIADLSSVLHDALKDKNKESRDSSTSCCLGRLSDDTTDNMRCILKHLRSVPVEPEWEEDDVYLSHRKNALTTMRSASRHSRAATNAFVRGDHFSAQQHSLKAEDLWLAAEELNSKAAKEILSVRNSGSEPWKLDLHGLHASEAVEALQEHLQKFETRVPINYQASQDMAKIKNGSVHSSLLESYNGSVEKIDKQQKAFRQRPALIEVITGVGKHSRGQAALPSAVRNFLQKNRYRFDETRPGTITVWLKFR